MIIHDEEFTELIDKAGVEQQRVLAWHDGDAGRPRHASRT